MIPGHAAGLRMLVQSNGAQTRPGLLFYLTKFDSPLTSKILILTIAFLALAFGDHLGPIVRILWLPTIVKAIAAIVARRLLWFSEGSKLSS